MYKYTWQMALVEMFVMLVSLGLTIIGVLVCWELGLRESAMFAGCMVVVALAIAPTILVLSQRRS